MANEEHHGSAGKGEGPRGSCGTDADPMIGSNRCAARSEPPGQPGRALRKPSREQRCMGNQRDREFPYGKPAGNRALKVVVPP
jgi:hypothetical protein